MKKSLLVFISIISLVLAACGQNESVESTASTDTTGEEKLVVGVMEGLYADIMAVAVEEAAKDGLEIEVVTFTDIAKPNTALVEGELDVNIFQHEPYMNQFNADQGADLVAVAKAQLSPVGIYSEKYESIDEVEDGATYLLPDDPTNMGRALLLLQEADLIKVKDGVENPEISDVTENPKNIEFVEVVAAQLARQLSEVDFGAINTHLAIDAGLDPINDPIFKEGTSSKYFVQIVVPAENAEDPALKKLVNAYQSDAVKQFIEAETKGALIPGWE